MKLDDPLNKTDHYQAVRKALWTVKPQWRNIGLALEIPVFRLDEFDGSLENKMDKVVEVWLNQDHTSNPTWRALINALRVNTVEGGKPVAAEIEKNHCGGQAVGQDLQTQNTSDQESSISSGSQYSSSRNPSQVSQSESKDSYRQRVFPCLNIMGNSEQERKDIISKLEDETDEMKGKFSRLMTCTSISLKKQDISPEELAVCVLSLRAFVPHEPDTALVDDDKEKIENSPSITKTFLILLKYTTFINYTVLEHIIEALGTQDDKESLKRYIADFEQFCQRSVFEIPSTAFKNGSSDTNRKTVTMKLVEVPDNSLAYFLRIERKIARALKVKPSVLIIRSVKEGCIELTFSLPEHVAKEVLPPSDSQLEALREASVQMLECEGKKYPCVPLASTPKIISKKEDSQSLPRYHKKATRKQKGLAVAVIGTLKIHSYFKPLCESAPTDQMEVEDSGVGTSASKEDSSSCTSSELTADPMVCSATASVDSMSLTISPKLLELQWKNLYYLYKDDKKDHAAVQKVDEIVEILRNDAIILGLGRYIKEFFPSMDCQHLLASLKEKPQYLFAERILKACGRDHECDPSEVLPLMVICSQSVHEVHAMFSDLLHPDRAELLFEVFYCLGTLFYALWNHSGTDIPSRFHYFVYHSLVAIELSYQSAHNWTSLRSKTVASSKSKAAAPFSTPSSSGVQLRFGHSSTSSFKLEPILVKQKSKPVKKKSITADLTPEQEKVATFPLMQGEVLRIMALAGTGKTTTLVKFAENHQDWKILYCAFNRSVKDYATTKFPKNVDTSTIHSLAYKALSVRIAFSGKSNADINVFDVAFYMSDKRIRRKATDYHLFVDASHVMKTLEAFIVSDDKNILTKHVPPVDKHQSDNKEKYLQQIQSAAVDVWEKMIDPQKKGVKLPHNGYLKLFQLADNPEIKEYYDCILVDEAQDLTPAEVSILMRQPCAKIFVGDSHQQIYTFRGAVNALEKIEDEVTATLYLTQSFRFGPEIAYAASCVLDHLKNERKQTIVGQLYEDGIDGKEEGQIAIVARRNSTLFDSMVTVCSGNTGKDSVKIGFAGGLKSYGLDLLLDVYRLMKGKREEVEDKLIKRFSGFSQLKEYAQDTEDVSLWGKIYICEKYGDDIPSHIAMIESQTGRIDTAGIVFSTVHKAKGLEFDTVKMTDDFLRSKGREDAPNEDEKNLLYVAVTRAKRRLVMTSTLTVKVFHEVKEDFIYPLISPLEIHNPIECPLCKKRQPMPPLQLQFRQRPLTLSDGEEKQGGIICGSCIKVYLPYMKPILAKAAAAMDSMDSMDTSPAPHCILST